jgi:hypothetical protein
MPKKEWTDEERKAFAEKMAASRANKQPAKITEETQTKIHNEDDIEQMKAQIEELKQLVFQSQRPAERPAERPTEQAPQGPQITATGMIGTLHKYNTDPNYYPDYSERLAVEPRLARFAFGENWELEQSVSLSSYTTIDNRRISEPKFTIQLIGKVFDEDGEDTGQRYVRKQMIWHEDPDSALAVAKDNGLNVKDYQEKEFLDEMRYIRVRDWLLENWYAPSNTNKKSKTRQQVIGNQVVDVYEVSSTTTASIPFNTLNGKVKD